MKVGKREGGVCKRESESEKDGKERTSLRAAGTRRTRTIERDGIPGSTNE